MESTTMPISKSRRGTAADYKAAVENNDYDRIYDKVFTFVLNHKTENPTIKNPRTGQGVKFPVSYTLPLIDSVRDTVNGGQKIIRYIIGEDTLERKKQKLDDLNYKISAEFTNGVKYIPGSDKLLLDFFMQCNFNGSNLDRDKTKNIIFYMVDSGEGLKDVVSKKKSSFELQSWCYNGDWDEVQAYARVLGIDMTLESSEIRYNLSLFAEKDPAGFKKGMNNPVTKRKHYALMAVERGILVVDDVLRTVSWPNGTGNISAAPPNISSIDAFVEATFTSQGEQVYATVLERLNPSKPAKVELEEVNVPKEVKVAPQIVTTGITFDAANSLFDKCLSKGVITKPTHNTFSFGEEVFRSKADVLTKMKEDGNFLSSLQKAVA